LREKDSGPRRGHKGEPSRLTAGRDARGIAVLPPQEGEGGMDPNWLLVIVGAILILIEVILGPITGFDFLLIAPPSAWEAFWAW
jgi:hypothetical protein